MCKLWINYYKQDKLFYWNPTWSHTCKSVMDQLRLVFWGWALVSFSFQMKSNHTSLTCSNLCKFIIRLVLWNHVRSLTGGNMTAFSSSVFLVSEFNFLGARPLYFFQNYSFFMPANNQQYSWLYGLKFIISNSNSHSLFIWFLWKRCLCLFVCFFIHAIGFFSNHSYRYRYRQQHCLSPLLHTQNKELFWELMKWTVTLLKVEGQGVLHSDIMEFGKTRELYMLWNLEIMSCLGLLSHTGHRQYVSKWMILSSVNL